MCHYIFTTSTPLDKIWSFPLRISSENVTKSAVSSGFGNITGEILNGDFFCTARLSSLIKAKFDFVFTFLFFTHRNSLRSPEKREFFGSCFYKTLQRAEFFKVFM